MSEAMSEAPSEEILRPAAVLRLAGRLAFLLVLPLLLGIEGGAAPTGQPEPAAGGATAEGPPSSKTSPEIRGAPPSGTILLFLPSIRESGQGEISPWMNPSKRDRFVAFEKDLAAKFSEHGYVVVTSSEALGRESARAVLENAAQPLTPRGAADAAGAVGATIALVIRAETIHHRGSAPSASHRTDAIVEALAYRPGDAVRLTRASTRVSGTGATRRDAEAAALVHAAGPLATNLFDSLAKAAGRPMIIPRPLPIFLEGELSWDQYKHILALIRDAIPEIVGVEERRFARGRFQLMATCGCDAPDAARRLDGRAGAGIKLTAEARDEGLILRAMPISFH